MTCRPLILVLIVLTWCGIAAAVLHRRNVRAAHAMEFQAARAGLYHVIPRIDLENVPLADAIDRIGRAGDVKIDARWDSLKRVEVLPDQPVRLRIEGYCVERVLDVLLATVGGSDAAGFEPRGGEVLLTARDELPPVVRVYDVRRMMAGRSLKPFAGLPPGGQISVANSLFVNQGQLREDTLYDVDYRAVIDNRMIRVDDRYGHSHAAELLRQIGRMNRSRASQQMRE